MEQSIVFITVFSEKLAESVRTAIAEGPWLVGCLMGGLHAQEQRVRGTAEVVDLQVVGVAKRSEKVQTDIAQRFERLEALLKKEG